MSERNVGVGDVYLDEDGKPRVIIAIEPADGGAVVVTRPATPEERGTE